MRWCWHEIQQGRNECCCILQGQGSHQSLPIRDSMSSSASSNWPPQICACYLVGTEPRKLSGFQERERTSDLTLLPCPSWPEPDHPPKSVLPPSCPVPSQFPIREVSPLASRSTYCNVSSWCWSPVSTPHYRWWSALWHWHNSGCQGSVLVIAVATLV